MKILLVGEYSRLHNSLKEGLKALNHEVTLIGDGDLFKKYEVDYTTAPVFFDHNYFTKKLRVAFYKLTQVDIGMYESALRFFFLKKHFKGYDVVQFINSNALKTPLKIQLKQIEYLKKHNGLLVLCACGTDTPVVDFLMANKMQNHILTPYLNGDYPEKHFFYERNYISKKYRTYYSQFSKLIDMIIASDMDYYIPYKTEAKFVGLIPNPINIDKNEWSFNNNLDTIIIFLGINKLSKIKKGSLFFEKALEIIQKKYPEKAEVIIVESLPYTEYMKVYNRAHILLDMVYAYDQGYNALEAMARGKVVFTGAEQEFLQHYNLKEDEVCINALPDVASIVEKLSWLIENPEEIKRIGQNARAFIEREHHYVKVAGKYLETWKEA